jgi:tetratricopeptide (TPR) repeat protein
MIELCNLYQYFDFKSAQKYANQGIELSQAINFYKGEIRALISLSGAFRQQGEIPISMNLLFKASQVSEDKHYNFETSMCLQNIGEIYWSLRDYPKAINYCKRARNAIQITKNNPKYYDLLFLSSLYIGISYSELNQLDSAFFYLQNNYKLTSSDKTWHPVALTYLSRAFL